MALKQNKTKRAKLAGLENKQNKTKQKREHFRFIDREMITISKKNPQRDDDEI